MGAVESNMAVASLFMVSDIEKEQCLVLRSHFHANIATELCDLDHPFEITRETLDEALLLLPPSDVAETDNKILEQLFVMHDRNFSNTADYKDLLVSFTFLISGDVKTKLLYAFSIYDEDEKGALTSGDLRKILHSLNITAMYFGDPGLTDLNIKEILHDLFLHSKVKTAPLEYMGFLDELADHDIVNKFLGGWGSAKFGDSLKNS
jgi:hypothetical protein